MNCHRFSVQPTDASEEIRALMETLLATEQRLEELTGGEVDTVAGRDGRAFLWRRAQEQLRFSVAARQAASLNDMRALFDVVPAMIWLKDTKDRILRVNQRAADMAGKSIEEIEGKPASEIHPPEAVRPHEDDLEAIHSGVPKTGMVDKLRDPKGQERWVQTDKVPVLDKDGKVTGLVFMAQDISERKGSEQAIERGLQRLNEAQRIGQIGDWDYDLATQAITWSPQVFEILGRDPRLGPPRTFEENAALFDGASQAVQTEKVARAIESGEAQDYELRAHRPDGTPVDVLGRAVPRKDESGKVVGLVGTVQDITARKRTEVALRSSEELFRIAAETANDVIYEWDLKQSVEWHGKIHGLLGYEPGEFPRTLDGWAASVHPEDLDRTMAAIQDHLEGRAPYAIEYRVRRKDGVYRWWSARGAAARTPDGKPTRLIGSITDITERKQAEAELEKSHQELVKASRQAGMAEVATGILHNVGNVLNSVNIASSCIADGLRKSKAANLGKVVGLLSEHEADLGDFLTVHPQGKQIPGYLAHLAEHLVGEQTAALHELAQLQKNIEHIKNIIAMQQGFAKVSGTTELLSVADLVEDALKMHASALARHDIRVHREFQEVPFVTVERHQVLQILVNLVRNAVQACAASGHREKQLIIRTANRDGRVRIAVGDNGVGIPSENLIRIFSHGFTTKQDGNGFGLHSGALAAQELGGALTVHSDGPGQGAVFTLELPFQPPTRESSDAERGAIG